MKYILIIITIVWLTIQAKSGETNFIAIFDTNLLVNCISEYAVNYTTNVVTNVVYTPINWCERIPRNEITNAVKDLIASGDVCAVIGHKWQSGCGMVGCLVIHTGNMRYCLICGKVETQEIGDWK